MSQITEEIVPRNVLCEILSRFPAKSIYKIKTTDKATSNLTEETHFIEKHVHTSLTRDDTCFFVQQSLSLGFNAKVKLYPLPSEKHSSGVPRDVLRFFSNTTKVLSSSKGLILCCTTNMSTTELFICNPATKSWLHIPCPVEVEDKPYVDPTIMLLESHDSDDYLLLHFESPLDWSSNEYVCNVFQPNEGTWRSLEERFFVGSRNMDFNMPVHHDGAVHVISNCSDCFTSDSPYFEPYIMSYNLESGTSTMLKLPYDVRKVYSNDIKIDMRIFNWGKVSSINSSICLVRLKNYVFKVWILRDYESSRWMRILKVDIKEMDLKEKRPQVKGFTVMNGDLLVFATGRRIYSCGLSDENYMKIKEICKHKYYGSDVCFTPYLDTLRLCGPGATPLPC